MLLLSCCSRNSRGSWGNCNSVINYLEAHHPSSSAQGTRGSWHLEDWWAGKEAVTGMGGSAHSMLDTHRVRTEHTSGTHQVLSGCLCLVCCLWQSWQGQHSLPEHRDTLHKRIPACHYWYLLKQWLAQGNGHPLLIPALRGFGLTAPQVGKGCCTHWWLV